MLPAAQASDNLNHVVTRQRPAFDTGQHLALTHASNEPNMTVNGDGRGFLASSSFAVRF